MKSPTALEKITGNVGTETALTLVAAIAGTPIAALLPVLSNTLAAQRHRERVLSTLVEIQSTLEAHSEALTTLTDPQYKFLNEVILTVLQNTEDAKLDYLRRAILGGLREKNISHTLSAQVSRALRDMTADELTFALDHTESKILIGPVTGVTEKGIHIVDRKSDDMTYVSGLLGLGVLIPAGSTMDDGGRYAFASFCHSLKKVIAPK